MSPTEGDLSLLDVPALLKEHGIQTMELCHFHLPAVDADFYSQFRTAMIENEIELWSLLIDDGDITDPENGDRDREWIESWIDRASHLGAKCVRVIGGKQPTSPAVLERSIEQLQKLSEYAEDKCVQVLTENWQETLSTPAALSVVLDDLRGDVGLCFDFGNWSGPTKYKDLGLIVKYATSCHAKCQYIDGQPDVADFETCLKITQDHGFEGPYTLVHGEAGRVWESIDEQVELLRPYL